MPARWDTLTGNLDRLHRLRRELRPWRRPIMNFHYVLMRRNLEELPAFVDLVARWGAHAVYVIPLIDVDSSLAAERLDFEDDGVRAVVAEAVARASRLGIGLQVQGVDTVPRPRPRRPMEWAQHGWRTTASALRPLFSQGPYYLFRKLGQRVAPSSPAI